MNKNKLFACGESVRRGRRTLRICREFVSFQQATVGDGSLSRIKNRAIVLVFSRNAEDGVPYGGFVLISSIFKRANAVRPYRVAVDFLLFFFGMAELFRI